MDKLIKLPSMIGDGRLDTIIRLLHIIRTEKENLKRLVLDWERTTTITPAGYALFAIIRDCSISSSINLKHLNIHKDLKTNTNLEKFFESTEVVGLPHPDKYNFHSKQLILKVKDSSIDPLIGETISSHFTDLDCDLAYEARLILNELMQNSVDHSSSERFYAYIGKWKKELHFGLLDMGIGIPTRLEHKYNLKDDLVLLKMSLKDGIGTRRIRKGGLGLYIVFETIKNNHGRLVLISGKAQFRKYFSTRRSQADFLKHPLSGTWIMIRVPWREKS